MNSLIQALPMIAKALGRNMGVKVEVDAGRARTDGNTIYLPALPINDDGVEILGLGLLIHEAGHIRYSDFSNTFNTSMAASTAIERLLAGTMEDARMEARVMGDYPGARSRLDALVTKLVADSFFEPVSSDNPASVLQGYLLYMLRAKYLGQEALSSYAENARAKLVSLISPAAVRRVDSLASLAVTSVNTMAILSLAHDISRVLEEEIKNQQQQQQANAEPSQGDGNGEDGDGSPSDPDASSDDNDGDDNSQSDAPLDSDEDGGDSSPSNSDAKDGQEESPQDNNDSSESAAGDSSDSDSNGGNGGGASDDLTDDQRTQAIDALTSILESKDDSQIGDLSDAFESLLQDEMNEAKGRGNVAISSMANKASDVFTPMGGQSSLDAAQATTMALRTKMVRLVQSQTKVKRKTSRHGRRLNDRKLSRIPAGNHSVFKSKSQKKGINTAVMVLTDISGSMDKSMELAMNSALSITAALKSIPKLSAASAVFPGFGSTSATEMTGFDDSMLSTAGYYPVISAHGMTPLYEALVWTAMELHERKESRKILIVITDGDPNEMQLSVDMIGKLRKSGVEVYGIGLRTRPELMTDLFLDRFSVSVESDDQLANATFSLLENTLYNAA